MAIAAWLLAVAAMVFAMVVVGGITRLTESGLSITEWKPITGAIPPLTEAAWMAEFEKYKRIPEYIEINRPAGMGLAEFKFIYFWEWAHRLLGRLVGVAFAVPLAWFAWKRAIPKGYGWPLVGLFAMGGLQGAIGWWMVTSGLAGRTDVSHFRLAVHLLLALAIIGGLVWTALDLIERAKGRLRRAGLSRVAGVAIAILFVQLLYGAYVAGLNAGYVANDWPAMNERFVPAGIDWDAGVAAAFLNDPYLTHFVHRWWAWVAVAALLVLARKARDVSRAASVAIHVTVGVQVLLGIATVMSGVALWIAVLHQAVGALVVAATAWAAHAAGRRRVRA